MHFYDLVIIGGGPAGLAAAIEGKNRGIEDVLILEQEDELGGMLNQLIHNSFGKNVFGKEMTGLEYVNNFVDEIIKLNIECKLNTTVLKISENKIIRAVNEEEGIIKIKAKSIIIATGMKEIPRGFKIPITKCTGIFTCETAHKILIKDGFLIGKNIVINGINQYAFTTAIRLKIEGAKVKIVTEHNGVRSELKKYEQECINDFNIPIMYNYSIKHILGKERVKKIIISNNAQNINTNDDNEIINCDTLLIAADLYPQLKIIEDTSIKIQDNLCTNINGIFACGNVIKEHMIVDNATLEGTKAGKIAAAYVLKKQYVVNL